MPFNYVKRRWLSPTRYIPGAVNFDGTNDFLTRDAGLTGASDGTQLTTVVWLRTGADGVGYRVFGSYTALGGGSATLQTRVSKNAANGIAIIAENAAGTIILQVASSNNSIETADGWVPILFSCDLTDTGKRHLYIGEVSDLATITTYTNDTIDHTSSDWAVGGDPDGGVKLNGDLAELWFSTGYVDFSVEANRRLFISSAGKPVNPAGAIAALGTPLIRLGGDFRTTGATSVWHTNNGSGGGFTENGAITDASGRPGD